MAASADRGSGCPVSQADRQITAIAQARGMAEATWNVRVESEVADPWAEAAPRSIALKRMTGWSSLERPQNMSARSY